MSRTPPGRKPNRLLHETSPYLLQHAYNPVQWYPWGEEALGRAKEERKPILLSIGYSACHWCHVMAHESFEDERIAALMNEHFVCVKVDREERPDLDEIYMAATQVMNDGQGGWPMTVFLTPEQAPFYAGTYFPPEDRYGRPGFGTLVTRLAELWRTQPERLQQQAREITEHLRREARATSPLGVGEAEVATAVAQLAESFDPEHGGFGGAPKFPPSTQLSLLLRHHRRTGDAHALGMVTKTLEAMARGGIHDQIGGGFHRYATDSRWLVPHFEKMLYDNALLARVYLEAFQVTGDPYLRRTSAEVLDYVLREMTSPEGAFTSSTDADSEGEEGKFFVWTPAEVEAAVGPADALRVCAWFDVTDHGNWEKKNILNIPRTIEQVARELHVAPEALEATIEASRPKLYAARAKRVAPGLDDKILTGWNGLMVSAMAAGAWVLGDARYLDAARRAADFLLGTLRAGGRLLRTTRQGKAHLDAVLEDYAYLCQGLIDLYEAGGGDRFLEEAEILAARMIEDFAAEEGGFYTTGRAHEPLLVRRREGTDGATPSPNASAAMALARLSRHLDREDFRHAAAGAVTAFGKQIARFLRAFARSLEVADFLLEPSMELVFVGAPTDPDLAALRRAAAGCYLPNAIVAHHDPSTGESKRVLLEGKGLVAGRAALYVCRDFTCEAPITDPAKAGQAIGAALRGTGERREKGLRILGQVLEGHATEPETKAIEARAGKGHGYALLGTTGLTVSRVGFGAYRIDEETPEHSQALETALRAGCNLIDTSTNYTDGGSERLVGEVLGALTSRGEIGRGAIVVVSKIGYVQGSNLALAREREAGGRPFPEMVKVSDDAWHCLHPEFLSDQLGRSLDRLRLSVLDVCLLHNPEYFLAEAAKRGDVGDDTQAEFYRRLRAAFAYFEKEIAAGRLRWYGVSSNTLARSVSDREATSLTRMLDAAREAGGESHHFRVLQLPLNLFEAGAVLERKEGAGGSQTVLDAAAAAGLGVLVNRPLNAMTDRGIVRLADVAVGEEEGTFEAVHDALARLEEEFRTRFAPFIRVPEKTLAPERFFPWAEEVPHLLAEVRSVEQWRQIQGQSIVPMTRQIFTWLDGSFTGETAQPWRDWRTRYAPALDGFLLASGRRVALAARESARSIAETIEALLPLDRRGETLSRKAIWVLASTPGVSCVLTGIRRPSYVEDALEVLRWPPLDAPERAYAAVRETLLR